MNIIKTTWRIEWLAAVSYIEHWGIAREGDQSKDTALYWLDWYRKQTGDTYRLVKIVETVVDA